MRRMVRLQKIAKGLFFGGFVASATSFAIACGTSATHSTVAAPSTLSENPVDVTPRASGGDVTESFGVASPESVGLDPRALADLAAWVKSERRPIFSILISRHGKLAFELYTSGFERQQAHYLMSVTKSFTGALTGIAIDQKLLASDDLKMSDALPALLFPSENDRARFANVTLHEVLGMSALDAQVPPHERSADAVARQKAFLASDNRARFALTQKILPEPGVSFQYTDITPYLAGAAVSYAANTTLFEFATTHLFAPLGFRNAEWMHEDAVGMDNAAYGLRLRPIDMQKFGALFLQKGRWNGVPVISESWVEKCFSPWIRSKPSLGAPNYGNYFWTYRYGPWIVRVANGWKGQRIAIVPSEDLVVTMTGDIEPHELEDETVKTVLEKFVVPAVKQAPLPIDAEGDRILHARLDEAHVLNLVPSDAEKRMLPSIAPKETHHALVPLTASPSP